MDAEKQLESQLEKELDEMSAEDLGVDAYDEYDLIVIPDEGKGSPQKASSESPQNQHGNQQDLCEESVFRLQQEGAVRSLLVLRYHHRCAPGVQAISVAISNPPPRGSSAQAAKPSVATKRRVPTSLIPTTVVRQEGAKKLRLILDEPGGTSSTSAPADVATNPEANGEEQKGDDQNEEEQKGEEKKGDDQNEEEQKGDDQKEEEMPAVVPKSNDDFRKMFLKD
ncbi:GM12648 [Drosophila sechellia]|uniref:GM12648 n=1 Tax=Drosophila sechellia TaxID=7238 RepID=B4I0Q7_DROSE|nr:GM12648 [Drosophila sechellia]